MGAMDPTLEFDKTVGLIYEAALIGGGWTAALVEIARQTESETFHLMGWDGSSQTELLRELPDASWWAELERYNEYYLPIDPRIQACAALPPGALMVCSEHFDARFVARNEVYQDCLLPFGIRYTIGATIFSTGQLQFRLGLMRGSERGSYTQEEIAKLRRLVPHLQRAAKLTVQAHSLNNLVSMKRAAEDLQPLAVVALSATGQIVDVNPRAETLLRSESSIKRSNGRLVAIDARSDTALRIAIKTVGEEGNPASLRITGKHATQVCYVTLVPVRNAGPAAGGLRSSPVICLIADHRPTPIVSEDQLRALFQLSSGEARVARSLASGLSLDETARVHAVKRGTVKTQLNGVFAKLAVDNQRDVIRLILRLPAQRD